MPQSAKAHEICSICLSKEQTCLRSTRNVTEDIWIQCDCCKDWLHASCGGFTIQQYNKINKDNIWIKCIICCLYQLKTVECNSVDSSLSQLVQQAVDARISKCSIKKSRKKKRKSNSKQSSPCSQDVQLSQTVTSDIGHFIHTDNAVHVSRIASSDIEHLSPKDTVVHSFNAVTSDTGNAVRTGINVCTTGEVDEISADGGSASQAKSCEEVVEVCCSTDTDKILIIDSLNNALEYSSSKRILQEVHNYFPQVKVEFAYSLAKGGVAIHTTCKSDRDLLLYQSPEESFGGGVRHPPKGKGFTVYVKGVDTLVDINDLDRIIQTKGVSTSNIRRLTKRYTGRPTQVIKVTCTNQVDAEKLLTSKIFINNRQCVVEREKSVQVVRCYNCQSLGHTAKTCRNEKRCEFCGDCQCDLGKCIGNLKCVNCNGNHASSSSQCPAYIRRNEALAK